MPGSSYRAQYQEILTRIQGLQRQLEQEFDRLLAQKREQFRYSLRNGKVIFDEGMRALHRRYRVDSWTYIRKARPLVILTAPIIYGVVIPLVILDLAIFIYQQTCFRVYGIPIVLRSDYIVIDRHRLSYLNAVQKFNCVYCGYGNGLIEYVREVFARTEQYWCPIKHARRARRRHPYAEEFADFGDAEHYAERLQALRRELREEE